MNGIVIVDKPAGWTSQDVVSKLRGVFKTRRIGHGGTLDPMATGVLPVFVGRATRAVEFFEHAEKTYIATLRLGISTDTEDITGNILEERPVSVTRDMLEQALAPFRGEISQVPPMYSAIKVNGQKLYELARKGREVQRQSRKVTIFCLECEGFDGREAKLLVHCSKGTYIRTLCKDIGESLGCGGCMASLRRVSAGAYTEENAVALATLVAEEDPEKYLLSTDSIFAQYPAVVLTENQEKRCRNGNGFTMSLADGTYRAYSKNGEFLMLAKVENGMMTTMKSFFEV